MINNIKANNVTREIGGKTFDNDWVYINQDLFAGVTFTANKYTTYSLDNYLPQDNYSYECVFSLYIRTGKTSGNAVGGELHAGTVTDRTISTNRGKVDAVITRTASDRAGGGHATLIISPEDRNVTYVNYPSSGTSGNCGMKLTRYRRLGTNDNDVKYDNVGYRKYEYDNDSIYYYYGKDIRDVNGNIITQNIFTEDQTDEIAQYRASKKSDYGIITSSEISNGTINAIAYGGGIFIAVSNDGYIIKSNDGIHYKTPILIRKHLQFQDIKYYNNKFIAIGYTRLYSSSLGYYVSTGYLYQSVDGGITWQEKILTPANKPYSIAIKNYNNCVIADVDGYLSYFNGNSISSNRIGYTNDNKYIEWKRIIYANNRYVAFGEECIIDSDRVVHNDKLYKTYSNDGLTWSTPDVIHSVTSGVYLLDAFYDGDRYCIVRQQGTTDYLCYLNSNNTLSEIYNCIQGFRTAILHDGKYIIIDTRNGCIIYKNKTTGNTERISINNLPTVFALIYAQNKIIAVGGTGKVLYKEDTADWIYRNDNIINWQHLINGNYINNGNFARTANTKNFTISYRE